MIKEEVREWFLKNISFFIFSTLFFCSSISMEILLFFATSNMKFAAFSFYKHKCVCNDLLGCGTLWFHFNWNAFLTAIHCFTMITRWKSLKKWPGVFKVRIKQCHNNVISYHGITSFYFVFDVILSTTLSFASTYLFRLICCLYTRKKLI